MNVEANDYDITISGLEIEVSVSDVLESLTDDVIREEATQRGILSDLSDINEDALIEEVENRDLESRIIEDMDINDLIFAIGTDNLIEAMEADAFIDYFGVPRILNLIDADVVIEFAKGLDSTPSVTPEVLAAFDVLSAFFYPDAHEGSRGI